MASGKKKAGTRPAKKGSGKTASAAGSAKRKAAVKKAPVKTAPVKKAAFKKAPVKNAAVKKAPVKKAPVKKAAVKKAAVKTAAVKTAAVKKAPVKTAPVKKMAAPAAKTAAPPRAAPATRTATRATPPRVASARALAPAAPALTSSATIITLAQYNSGDTQYQPWNRGEFRYRMLAQGDSWFSVNGVPTINPVNALEGLKFDATAAIVSLAYPGTELQYLANMTSDASFRRLLNDSRFGGTWDVILFSGGGNDLIDRAGTLLQTPADQQSAETQDFVDPAALQQFVSDIRSGYTNIVNARDATDSPNQGVPVFTHTYSYVVPRDSPALPGVGPWLFKAFTAKGIDPQYWSAVSNYLIDQLAETLLALAGTGGLPNFIVLDTRCVLTPAAPGTKGSSNDFLNEIHPNAAGYTKLGAWLSARLAPLLASRPAN